MDFSKIARKAKVPAIEGSMKKNPDWKYADFEAFREKANAYCPVLTCSGDKATGAPMIATVSAKAADIDS